MTTALAAPFTVDYGHVELVSVHFDDLDAMGVVHNARYALLLERAMAAFWAAQGHSFVDGRPTTSDSFNVVKEYRITYHTPIRTAGDVAVHLWTDRVGETSGTYGFRIVSVDGSTVHAEGIRVVVKLDPATMRPAAWTPESRVIADRLARVHTRPAV
jgi:acyl-CoA thioester hydrolase